MALDYYNLYDYEKAIALFEKEPDDGLSLHYLGECYYYGRGVEKDVMRAKSYFRMACKKKYAKSFAYTAFILEADKNYAVEQIINMYKIGSKYSNSEADTVFIKYHCILFMIDCLQNEILLIVNLADLNHKIEVFIDIMNEIMNESPETKYLLAEILSSSNNRLYHHIAILYSQRTGGVPSPIYLYQKAAEGGVLKATTRIAEHYYNHQMYSDMVSWYWWSVYYDPTTINEGIIEAIRVNKLRKLYNSMTLDRRATKTDVVIKRQIDGDNRPFEDYIKREFLDTLIDNYYDKLCNDASLTETDKRAIITSLQRMEK